MSLPPHIEQLISSLTETADELLNKSFDRTKARRVLANAISCIKAQTEELERAWARKE